MTGGKAEPLKCWSAHVDLRTDRLERAGARNQLFYDSLFEQQLGRKNRRDGPEVPPVARLVEDDHCRNHRSKGDAELLDHPKDRFEEVGPPVEPQKRAAFPVRYISVPRDSRRDQYHDDADDPDRRNEATRDPLGWLK